MNKPVLAPHSAFVAIEVAVDKVFEDRVFEFVHNLMLEAEDKVEELWDVSALEKNCDSDEKWYDSLRTETLHYINSKIREMYKTYE